MVKTKGIHHDQDISVKLSEKIHGWGIYSVVGHEKCNGALNWCNFSHSYYSRVCLSPDTTKVWIGSGNGWKDFRANYSYIIMVYIIQ